MSKTELTSNSLFAIQYIINELINTESYGIGKKDGKFSVFMEAKSRDDVTLIVKGDDTQATVKKLLEEYQESDPKQMEKFKDSALPQGYDENFTVLPAHIELLKRSQFHFAFGSLHFGAPAVGLRRPYGNSDIMGDLEEITGIHDGEQLLRLHYDMARVFEILVDIYPQQLFPGKYTKPHIFLHWKKLEG